MHPLTLCNVRELYILDESKHVSFLITWPCMVQFSMIYLSVEPIFFHMMKEKVSKYSSRDQIDEELHEKTNYSCHATEFGLRK